MTDTLPMLEEHPFVPRYNWMSALTENDVEMNEKDTYALNGLGMQYNTYVWNGIPIHNPQWGNFNPTSKSCVLFLYTYAMSVYTFPNGKNLISIRLIPISSQVGDFFINTKSIIYCLQNKQDKTIITQLFVVFRTLKRVFEACHMRLW